VKDSSWRPKRKDLERSDSNSSSEENNKRNRVRKMKLFWRRWTMFFHMSRSFDLDRQSGKGKQICIVLP
jgi:hypothetical protein